MLHEARGAVDIKHRMGKTSTLFSNPFQIHWQPWLRESQNNRSNWG